MPANLYTGWMIFPVILSGGSGSRLWPLSRQAYPKQFLSLGSDTSLLQQTLSRVLGCVSAQGSGGQGLAGKGLVVCNEEHRFLVAEQLRGCNECDILIEPEGKNTAPALALAAFQLMKQNSGQVPVMLVTPADHQISDDHAFVQAVEQLLPMVEGGNFGTLGLCPRSRIRAMAIFRRVPNSLQVSAVWGVLWKSQIWHWRSSMLIEVGCGTAGCS